MKDHRMPADVLTRFENGCYSKHKWLNLFRYGALQRDDEFLILSTNEKGSHCSLPTTANTGHQRRHGETLPGHATHQKLISDLSNLEKPPPPPPNTTPKTKIPHRWHPSLLPRQIPTAKRSSPTNRSPCNVSAGMRPVHLGDWICAKHHLWELCVRQWVPRKGHAGRKMKNWRRYPSSALGKRKWRKRDGDEEHSETEIRGTRHR